MQKETITSQGIERTYYINHPPRLSVPAPVVMLLHGSGGNGEKIADSTGILGDLRARHFILVCPNALQTSTGLHWTDGRSQADQPNYDDSVFLSDLVAQLVAHDVANPSRICLGGESSGGMMTLKMMCLGTVSFDAYCVVIANLPTDLTARPTWPIHSVHMIGTADPIMPFLGGAVSPPNDSAGGTVLSAADTIAIFQANDNLPAPVVTSPPPAVNDGTSIVLSEYGPQLAYYEVVGGGHQWPGSPAPSNPVVYGLPTKNLNGLDVMLSFFGFTS